MYKNSFMNSTASETNKKKIQKKKNKEELKI